MSSIIEVIDELEGSIVDCKRAYDQFCDTDMDNISLWGTYSAIELILPDIKYSIQDLYVYFNDFNENDVSNNNISTLNKSKTVFISYTQYLFVIVAIKKKFPSIKTKEIRKKVDINPKIINSPLKKTNILNEDLNIIEPSLLTGLKSSGNTGSFFPLLPKHINNNNNNNNNNIKILRLSSENIHKNNNNHHNNNDNNNDQLNSIRRSRIRKFQNDINTITSIIKLCDNKVNNKIEIKNEFKDTSISYIPKFPSRKFCLSTSINFNNGSPFDWFRDIQIFETIEKFIYTLESKTNRVGLNYSFSFNNIKRLFQCYDINSIYTMNDINIDDDIKNDNNQISIEETKGKSKKESIENSTCESKEIENETTSSSQIDDTLIYTTDFISIISRMVKLNKVYINWIFDELILYRNKQDNYDNSNYDLMNWKEFNDFIINWIYNIVNKELKRLRNSVSMELVTNILNVSIKNSIKKTKKTDNLSHII